MLKSWRDGGSGYSFNLSQTRFRLCMGRGKAIQTGEELVLSSTERRQCRRLAVQRGKEYEAKFGPAVTVGLTGPVPSWFEAMF